MDANLIIDDDYVQTVGSLCSRRGRELEEYSAILDEIQQEALMEGDISVSLNAYRECVSLLSGQLEKISAQVDYVCDSFITAVNDADSYLF